ncbi:N-acetylglucosamine-6-phosphate deacetylase [Alkalihalobacillus sp. TS-13]|uniref:N-acetylglucosamine-6-phosphate deacetylase n=1 Tax=Alkalihalobacillus sp. TS-13 TaxID=2842455 RepID=UPI001C87CE67|nr:N-acetylglucosamine-6-phosphate deacetylase [Alkalihalobacillus sp. TS-13]
MYYLQGSIITGGRVLHNQFIEITDGLIAYIGEKKRDVDAPVKVVEKGYICPGFIDTHIHGVDGGDFMDEEDKVFEIVARQLVKYGVTACLATSRTAVLSDVNRFLDKAEKHMAAGTYGARILGVHLEGPWISSKYNGAQPKKLIRKLTWRDVKEVIDPYADIISKITLAPEELEDQKILKYLRNLDIQISAGHTNATLEEIEEAAISGLSQLTHTFNAMSPIHHRSPGTAAAALYIENFICELIADGVHVNHKMIELLYKVKGMEGIAIISDCTGYNQLTDGEYTLRGKELVRKGNEVRLKNGSLAGSAITLNEGVKYMVEHCNIPLEAAIFMATEIPAKAAGTNEKIGKIEPGCIADIVILGSDLQVLETIIAGELGNCHQVE